MARFIDMHVHPPTVEYLDGPFAPFVPALEATFRRELPRMSADEIADYYRGLDGVAVLLGWDAETATGLAPFSTEDVAALVVGRDDVFIGFGAVDPHKPDAAATVRRAADLGMRGLKLHPSAQCFSPGDAAFTPVFEAAAEAGLVCLFHTGYTGVGAGLPGGAGVMNHYANPMHLDTLAARIPELQIIAAHPSWPWQQEALAVAQHKPTVHLELSGWSPRRMDPDLIRAATGQFKDRTLFGSDFPFITPERWMAAWDELDVDDSVTQLILHDNAARLLGV